MGIERFVNVVDIIMNGPVLSRIGVINKLLATEQRFKANVYGGAVETEPYV